MKKTRTLAAITALTMLIGANAVPFRAEAYKFVSDNAYTAFDSADETAYVKISYEIDQERINAERDLRVKTYEEKIAEVLDGLDITNYRDVLSKPNKTNIGVWTFDESKPPSETEFYIIKETIISRIRYEINDLMLNEQRKQMGDEILAEIDVVPDDDTAYPNFGQIWCNMNREQLAKAEACEKIKIVSVAEDWDGYLYIGTPEIPKEPYVNTACADADKATTTDALHTAVNASTTTTAAETETTLNTSLLFTKYGDANLDDNVTLADAVAILQHIGCRDKYALKEQGLYNADVDGVKGVTANDARVIMQWDAGIR